MKSINSENDLLKSIMKLIARQFGDKCEIVLHDWSEGYDKSIVAIENGHVSGRKVGDPGSNLGLEVMRGSSDGTSQYNYVTRTKDGKTLRSSSLYLTNDEGEKIGALCINFDISDILTAQKTLGYLSMIEQEQEEKFVNDVSELLEYLLQESVRLIGKAPDDMSKEDKIKAIQFLNDSGAFLVTKSGNKVSEYFGISKFTMYSYINEVKE